MLLCNKYIFVLQSELKKKRVCPKKKKYYYYVPVNPLPRILKRDIRRDYAIMLTNAINSCDASHLTSFLQCFALPELYFIDEFRDATNNTLAAVQIEKNYGIQAVVNSIMICTEHIPDLVLKVKSVQIVQRKGMEGSVINIHGEYYGTKLPTHSNILERTNSNKGSISSIEDLSTIDSVMSGSEEIATIVNTKNGKSPFLQEEDNFEELLQEYFSNDNDNQDNQNNHSQSHSNSNELTSLSSSSTSDDYQSTTEPFYERDSYLQKKSTIEPIDLVCTSFMTLSLDAQHRLYQIKFVDYEVF